MLLGITSALGGTVYGITLPPRYTATVSVEVPGVDPHDVFDLVTDPDRAAKWRPGVERVTPRERIQGLQWYEEVGTEPLTIEVRSTLRPHRYVTAIVDNARLRRSWTWTFEATRGGTRVTIIEDGEDYDWWSRAGKALVFGDTRAMERRLAALRAYFAP